MEAVLSLIEHDGLRPVNDLIGHLIATVGRKTVHEKRLISGGFHEVAIHLKRLKDSLSFFHLPTFLPVPASHEY